jgi:hypothetical protein
VQAGVSRLACLIISSHLSVSTVGSARMFRYAGCGYQEKATEREVNWGAPYDAGAPYLSIRPI